MFWTKRRGKIKAWEKITWTKRLYSVQEWKSIIKVGLVIFDFCTYSRRLISTDSISSPNFSWGCSCAERALWCRDSKRRALGNYFPVWIYYDFLMSKCRGDWDLCQCFFSFLSFFHPFSDGKIRLFLRANRVFFRKSLVQRFSFRKYPKKCTDLDLSLLYILVSGTYSKFARKNNFLSLCARRSHRRAALLRTLQWLSKFCNKIRRGSRKKQVGVLKRRVSRQCLFQFGITSCFCYVVVAISMMEIATTT